MMTQQRMRHGVSLAMVLIAAVIATMLWANSYSLFQAQVKLQERAKHGYTGGVPDKGAAAAWAVACLRAQLPATSGSPPASSCTLTLGAGANQRTFGIRTIDRTNNVWEIEVIEGDRGWSPCASCPGAGGQ